MSETPPVFTPVQQSQVTALCDRLNAEMARRGVNPDTSTRQADGSSPPPDDAPRGTTRPLDENNDKFSDRLMDDTSVPYTLEQGREFKRHKGLSGPSDMDADFLFEGTSSSYLIPLVVISLQNRDLLQLLKADQDKKYKLPDTLVKTCQDWAHIAMLSPKARSYRNIKDTPSIASIIVAAMRMLGVTDMPPSMETGQFDLLLTCLSKALTEKRYHIKLQLFMSLIGEKVDIATLTRSCIGTSQAKATAAVYQRLVPSVEFKATPPKDVESPAAKSTGSDQFWAFVDARLTEYHNEFNAAERQVMFEVMYRDDLEAHGQPDSKIPLTLMHDVEAWLTTLNMAMER
ncbi:hypothetical protein C8R44DRAFT_876680 [Mycena epipterygia]|nr:hypothetical protein C8R44DRAFT_876680 [Mycena epipterygia]